MIWLLVVVGIVIVITGFVKLGDPVRNNYTVPVIMMAFGMIILFACLFFRIYQYVEADVEQCRQLGGVLIRGACINKEAVIRT